MKKSIFLRYIFLTLPVFILFLTEGVFGTGSCVYAAGSHGPSAVRSVYGTDGIRLEWDQEITGDIEDGEYLTDNLGMYGVTRRKVLQTVRDNWTKGLRYSSAIYKSAIREGWKCVNYGTRQYSGSEASGYGYNCSGFVASVLYYANGGTREDAYARMSRLYQPLIRGRRTGQQSSFADSSGWYYYFNGQQYNPDGTTGQVPRTKLYYAGIVKTSADVGTHLDRLEKAGKLKAGYIVYFWPTGYTDCHVGVYAGKTDQGVHMMYHAIGKGTYKGISIDRDIALTPVIPEFDSYLYILPLPDGTTDEEKADAGEWINGWWYGKDPNYLYLHTASWRKDKKGWWYGDDSGWYAKKKWEKIDGRWYYFNEKGYMAENEWRRGYWLDKNGAWRYKYRAAWKKDKKGWWYGDTSGWYAKGTTQKIDGVKYSFDKEGYLVEK